MIAHCLFEQSGTFKNEFKKLGINAFDYDLQDEFGQTDFKIDLFLEIEKAYKGGRSIFDNMTENDILLAFFPCTRFEARVPLLFRGEAHQQKNWSDVQKLEYDIKLHDELHELYVLLCKLCITAIRRGIKLIIENPCTQPHYLTTYFCLKPSIMDKDRTLNGDYYKKPTQFWFINCKPLNNLVFEPLEVVERRVISRVKGNDTCSCTTVRSMIHPQYARRFIKQYILQKKMLQNHEGRTLWN